MNPLLRLTLKATSLLSGLIVSDPAVMMGKPVVNGTRITVELIPETLAAGETVQDLLDAHPRLTEKAIRAALALSASDERNP